MKNAGEKNTLELWLESLPKGSFVETKDSNIKFEEKGSKIVFENKSNKTCIKVNVDGGVIAKNTELRRCDNLLVVKQELLFSFVELKGKDIGHAIEQLEASLKNPVLNPTCAQKKKAYAVGKNQIPLTSPFVQNKQKMFKTTLCADLIVCRTPATSGI